jgi:Ankyrin repeats (many copies)
MVSRRGHAEVAHILLEYGADVSTQANLGLTPLLLASRRGTVEVVLGGDFGAVGEKEADKFPMSPKRRQV